MKYLLKDWGLAGHTSPLDQGQAELVAEAAAPAVTPPTVPLPEPPEFDLTVRARSHADECVETILEVMRDRQAPATSRLNAAAMMLDRGYGKPLTVIPELQGARNNVTINVNGDISPGALRERLKRAKEVFATLQETEAHSNQVEGDPVDAEWKPSPPLEPTSSSLPTITRASAA